MTKWIRIPGPGQFRGEGEWKRIEDIGCDCPEAEWEHCRDTGYLPTHEGDEPPPDDAK